MRLGDGCGLGFLCQQQRRFVLAAPLLMSAPFFSNLAQPVVPTPPVARRLDVADLGWATELLRQAVAEHPAIQYVCAGPAANRQQQWLLTKMLGLVLHHGGAYANVGRTALVLWLGPGLPWRLRLSLLIATWHLGWAASQRLRHLLRTATWLRRQSLAGPHHLLLAVAVHPAARSRGEGRRLLAATLALRQAPPLPCYFSAQEPNQLAYYQGLGFELTGHCVVGTGPAGLLSNWGLWRPAPP
jgi:ribosomal protein S18 acetylase RimI-like enzyme